MIDALEISFKSGEQVIDPSIAAFIVTTPNQKPGATIMSMKDAYVKKLKAKMDEWSAEIDKLKAKAESVETDAKIEYLEQVDTLRKEQLEAAEKLNELENASESAWEDLKAGVESSWDSLESAVKKAASRFS